jgi:hypothetical protein
MRAAIADLQLDVSRIRDVTLWLDTPEAFKLRQATDVIRSGCVVLLCSYFETFVKDLVKAFIREVNNLGRDFGDLPAKMRYAHFERGGQCLAKASRDDRRNGNTILCDDLASRIYSVTLGLNYTLVWEAFADTKANPRPEVLSEILGLFEIDNVWKKIDRRARGRGEILKTFLETFIETRNVIAHTGSGAQPPTSQELRDNIDNITAIAHAIVDVLEDRLAEL